MSEVEIVGGAVVFAGWAGRKLLGPLFDEIAEDWRNRYSDYRIGNLNRIGRNAQAKVGGEIEADGVVPTRVALRLMEEGSWCEAPVMMEYFGGILAASRSADGDDDRGAAWASLVGRLSTFDIYLHYLAYDAIRRVFKGQDDLNFGIDTTRHTSRVYLPGSEIFAAMKVEDSEENWTDVLYPSMNALLRENLLGDEHAGGNDTFMRDQRGIDVDGSGILVTPSVPGLELFLWAHGHAHLGINHVLKADVEFKVEEDLGSIRGARSVQALQQERRERLAAEALAIANTEK
jgi:hypothetical protein